MSNFVNTVDILGEEGLMDQIIQRTITEFRDNTGVRPTGGAFYECKNLQSVSLPESTEVGNHYDEQLGTFGNCTALTSVDLPKMTICGSGVFFGCSALTRVVLPKLKTNNNGGRVFQYCNNLVVVDLPKMASLGGNYNFYGDSNIKALILRNEAICELGATTSFTNSSIASGTGYIYAPRALVNSYKSATNWSNFANQFRALEDYTVDGTITGELDESKI